jgi:hypothetical protein
MLRHPYKRKGSVFYGGVRVERHGRKQPKRFKTAGPMQVERHERAASRFSPPEWEALGVYPVISLPLELHRLKEGKMTL